MGPSLPTPKQIAGMQMVKLPRPCSLHRHDTLCISVSICLSAVTRPTYAGADGQCALIESMSKADWVANSRSWQLLLLACRS